MYGVCMDGFPLSLGFVALERILFLREAWTNVFTLRLKVLDERLRPLTYSNIVTSREG